jgi:hypothetical protein
VKSRALLAVAIVVLLAGCSGLPFLGGPSVSNIDSDVIEGEPAVVFDYESEDYATAILEGPDGDAIYEARLEPQENQSALWMGEPRPGEYTVVILQGGETVTEQSVTFEGANVTVDNYDTGLGQNEVQIAELTLQNTGDLPLILNDAVVTVTDQERDIQLSRDIIETNETVTVGFDFSDDPIIVSQPGELDVSTRLDTNAGSVTESESHDVAPEDLSVVSTQTEWEGDELSSLTAQVTNEGDISAETTVRVMREGEILYESDPVTVYPSSTDGIELDPLSGVFDAQSGGEYEFEVVASSENDQASVSITEQVQGASIGVESVNAEWSENGLTSVTTTLSNSGEFDADRTITASVEGEQVAERDVTVRPDGISLELVDANFGDPPYIAETGGTYETTVTVETPDGAVTASDEITFDGPDAEITEIDTTFLSAGYDTGEFEPSTISIEASNSGDLALLYDEVRVSLAGETETQSVSSAAVEPEIGGTEFFTFEEPPTVEAGTYDIEVEFLNDGDVVLEETQELTAE